MAKVAEYEHLLRCSELPVQVELEQKDHLVRARDIREKAQLEESILPGFSLIRQAVAEQKRVPVKEQNRKKKA